MIYFPVLVQRTTKNNLNSNFFNNVFKLSKSLAEIYLELPRKYFKGLSLNISHNTLLGEIIVWDFFIAKKRLNIYKNKEDYLP